MPGFLNKARNFLTRRVFKMKKENSPRSTERTPRRGSVLAQQTKKSERHVNNSEVKPSSKTPSVKRAKQNKRQPNLNASFWLTNNNTNYSKQATVNEETLQNALNEYENYLANPSAESMRRELASIEALKRARAITKKNNENEIKALREGKGTSLHLINNTPKSNTMKTILNRLPRSKTRSKALLKRLRKNNRTPAEAAQTVKLAANNQSGENDLAEFFGAPQTKEVAKRKYNNTLGEIDFGWGYGLKEKQENTLRKSAKAQKRQNKLRKLAEELQKRPQTLYTQDPFTSEFNFFYNPRQVAPKDPFAFINNELKAINKPYSAHND